MAVMSAGGIGGIWARGLPLQGYAVDGEKYDEAGGCVAVRDQRKICS
jgi:hypothetical protein